MSDFVVGIDLGTTHTVVAYAPVSGGDIRVLPIPQLVAPGEVAAIEKLPSSIYLPTTSEVTSSSTTLPWGTPRTFDDGRDAFFLGAYAYAQGAKVPGRQIVSAKSWLSYALVERRAPILPWGGLEDVPRLSPVEVAARILDHVRHAWDMAHVDAPLASQDVIITVPASFDEIARTLTVEAATKAGLTKIRLVEEPQAAFYDFLGQNESGLMAALDGVRLLLIVDVGGGTTDLTLVEVVREEKKPPRLERVAVGEHLMLGGDNMDATMARHVEMELTGAVGAVTASEWGQLVQSSRLAKETLLSDDAPSEMGVALLGRGSRLVGAARTYPFSQALASSMVLDGFFPVTDGQSGPEKRERTALTSLSLPYAHDTAIPRHVNAFLRKASANARASGVTLHDGLPRPDAVLLNGGVFKSSAIVRRFQNVLAGWYDGASPRFLVDDSNLSALDLAVARGATYAGLVRHGRGVRIGSGSPRAYCVGVTDDDGVERALVVAPKGMIEGASVEVDRTFRLRLGKPVSFPLFLSDSADAKGTLLDVDDDVSRLPPIQTVLNAPEEVPVRVRAHLTEVGTLELSLSMTPEALTSWKLDFSTRIDDGGETASAARVELPARIDDAKEAISQFFGARNSDANPNQVKQLRRKLEGILGPRETWSLAASRELFGVFIANPKSRRRSPDHERIFFQLVGWLVRPGFGAPLDDWRVSELFALFSEGVQHVKEKQTWASYWLTWRRCVGGLDAAAQLQIYDVIRHFVLPKSLREGKPPPGPKLEGVDEAIRLAASLERLPVADKTTLGEAVFHLRKHEGLNSWWALGRVGAREPFRGSIHDVVAAKTANAWLEKLLQLKWNDEEGASFAAAQLARRTNDRARDIDDDIRERVWRKLESVGASPSWIEMVREYTPRLDDEGSTILGDSLPVGLRIG